MSRHVIPIQCFGRDASYQSTLTKPVFACVDVSSDGEHISLNVQCRYNTGSHGQRCKASHPNEDKVGDGVFCPYAIDLPYAPDLWHQNTLDQQSQKSAFGEAVRILDRDGADGYKAAADLVGAGTADELLAELIIANMASQNYTPKKDEIKKMVAEVRKHNGF